MTPSDIELPPGERPALEATTGHGQSKPRRYRGATPDERKEQRRQRLLEAGLELFGTVGYANTSVERICSTSGVTGRHFYEEFSSREALLQMIFDESVDSCMEAVLASIEGVPIELDALLRAGIGAYVATLLADRRRVRIVTMEVMGVSDELETHRRNKGAAFADFMRDTSILLIEAGAPISGHPLTPVALVGAIHELTRAWVASEFEVELADIVAEAIRIVRAVALAPTT